MRLPDKTILHGGKYSIVRFISSGGFGCTYEAEVSRTHAHVAIKEFFVKDFCNRGANSYVSVATQSKKALVAKLHKKFIEEARAINSMRHRSIVRVLDIFEENGTAYYVMEYIDGRSLHEIVKERGALPEDEAVNYICQVADALRYVHSLSRLHLDVKPGNIMVSHGRAILIDFGASKHYDEESGENTSTLLGVNTKGYAPVEQSTQSFTTFSPATDIYALGATLYKLLTGITPPDAIALMSEDETLRPLPSTISENTRKAVLKSMEVKRKNRPQTIDEFLELLSPTIAIYTQVDDDTVIDEDKKQALGRLIASLQYHPARVMKTVKTPRVVKTVKTPRVVRTKTPVKTSGDKKSKKRSGFKENFSTVVMSISVGVFVALSYFYLAYPAEFRELFGIGDTRQNDSGLYSDDVLCDTVAVDTLEADSVPMPDICAE